MPFVPASFLFSKFFVKKLTATGKIFDVSFLYPNIKLKTLCLKRNVTEAGKARFFALVFSDDLFFMKFLKKYTIEDLLTNESFLHFYFQKNEDDVLDWEDWRDEAPANAALVAQAFGLLDRLSLRWDAAHVQAHWEELRKQIRSETPPEWTSENTPGLYASWNLWVAVAASFLLLASVGIGWWRASKSTELLALTNEHADRLMIYTLSDGTKIQVKPHSKVLVSNDFGKTTRDLHLSGEATFEVAKNPARPFRVFSGDLSVTALGTTFSIRAVEGEAESKVVLTEGKVRVENFSESDPTRRTDELNPGEEISLRIKEKRLSPKRKTTIPVPAPKAEAKSALQAGSWIQFNQTPFADVATSLEYNFGIQFSGIYPELLDMPVSYQFRGDRPLIKILQDLSLRCHFDFEVRGTKVMIEKEKTTFQGNSE